MLIEESLTMKVTNNALEILEYLVGKDSQMQQMVTESYLNAEVGQLIYETRTKAELTQKQLADMIGIEESILADVEEGDYEGNALIILHKIATFFNKKLKMYLASSPRWRGDWEQCCTMRGTNWLSVALITNLWADGSKISNLSTSIALGKGNGI
jgi:transcriptional regulator with XRE-family HTH domain